MRDGDGRLLMYRGNGAGGWATGVAQTGRQRLGSASRRCSRPATSAATATPTSSRAIPAAPLLMYRGDGDGGWVTGAAEKIGSGWGPFSSILAGGDFSGDGKPDVLAVNPDGALLMYRGNGAGGWATGTAEPVGSRLGAASPRLPAAETSTATARPTCSPASPTASCCSTAATARAAGSRATASRSAAAGTPSLT